MSADEIFETLKAKDMLNERRIFRREVTIILVIALLVTAYLVALWLMPGTPPAPRA